MPISSPESEIGIRKLPDVKWLEGFSLLHLDLYKDDPAVIGWVGWIAETGLPRLAPERRIRFRRMSHGLNAVLSNAVLMVCSLALISDLVTASRIALPYPAATGSWTEHAYQVRFAQVFARPQIDRFRRWLMEECRQTQDWRVKLASQKGA